MNTTVWHSKGSAETATWLAEQLEIPCGTLPSAGFAGLGICWGAAPAEKFNWTRRNFRALFNDPRKVRKYRARSAMYAKIGETGINAPSTTHLSEASTYANICNLFTVTHGAGFAASRDNGTSARLVTNNDELAAAIADGCSLAITREFLAEDRIRIFVVSGNVVACVRYGNLNNERLAEVIAGELHEGEDDDVSLVGYQKVLRAAFDKDYARCDRRFWTPYTAISLTAKTAAINACQALEFDFGAVDIVLSAAGEPTIINVVTTPNLREVPSAQQPIITAIRAWMSEKVMTPHEILKDLVENIDNDAEADAILEKLREIKGQLVASDG